MIQIEQPKTWAAFKRRVHHIIDFDKKITPVQLELKLIEDEELPFKEEE